MGFYDRYILPPLLNKVMGAKPIEHQRRKVVPEASGTVLEIGMGAGHNLPFYDKSRVSRLIGLEPHPKMRERAAARAKEAAIGVGITVLNAEGIDLPEIYYAHQREVFSRNGMWLTPGEWGGPAKGETLQRRWVRYRTVGDMSCTGAVDSQATDVQAVIEEIIATRITERGATRADDKLGEAAMEDRKREGYF